MQNNRHYRLLIIFICTIIFYSCTRDVALEVDPKPYNLVVPNGLPPVESPSNNPLTVEGVALGRKLFYDPILSANNTQACANCHNQANAFSDTNKFSKGISGALGNRQAMPLFNLAYAKNYFWDGREISLEAQALKPIENIVEMNAHLPDVLNKLNANAEYKNLFHSAFGGNIITKENLAKALAQFERTLLSGNSKYDRFVLGIDTLSTQEMLGLDLFGDFDKGDCTHCHSLGSTFTDFEYKNNGLDATAIDSGRYLVTKNIVDMGKMKTPSLRNLKYTAPYMHDGRFNTLQEVLFHYNIGFKSPPNLDVNMASHLPNRMTVQEVNAIIAFLNTLNDDAFINRPEYGKP